MTFEWTDKKILFKLCTAVLGISIAIFVYFSEFTIETAIRLVKGLTMAFCVYCAGMCIIGAYSENNKLHGKPHLLDDDEMWDLRDRLINAEYEIDSLKKEIQRKY